MKIDKKMAGAVIAAALIAAFGSFLVTSSHYQKKEDRAFGEIKSIRENNSRYHYINPLLAYDLPESQDLGEYSELHKKLTDLVEDEKSSGKADDISVYFRGNQGRWLGVNENERYYPASLLKVVVMMAYYDQAQSDPSILGRAIIYSPQIQSQVVDSEFNTPSSLKLNISYKVDDLIRYMIVDSDNGATYTLLDSLNDNKLDQIYSDFGLQGPNDNSAYEISTRNYSLFFRILYNATYLNREFSEKALSLLSQTKFKDGLLAGLPSGTAVAHKFGEHVLNDDKGNQIGVELHDCGLVYGRQNYLLCVMTRGKNVDELKNVIKDISALVYNENN
ncbi:MAG: class A beta-lactamase-related serine hydrolase [Candidatus Doudnabacteria bacterium]|nr:class A beta-lactamase-related serine hydrolase [Candidatus Doudnabacteria bacterium]